MIMSIAQPAACAAVHSSLDFGEPSLISKLLLCAYGTIYDCAILLLISCFFLRSLINTTCVETRLHR